MKLPELHLPPLSTRWLFRDPLRFVGFLNADKFPYRRQEGDLRIDFAFKMALYGLIYVIAAFSWEVTVFGLVLWILPNWMGRNTPYEEELSEYTHREAD